LNGEHIGLAFPVGLGELGQAGGRRGDNILVGRGRRRVVSMGSLNSSVNCLVSPTSKIQRFALDNASKKPYVNSKVGSRENTRVLECYLKEEPAQRG